MVHLCINSVSEQEYVGDTEADISFGNRYLGYF